MLHLSTVQSGTFSSHTTTNVQSTPESITNVFRQAINNWALDLYKDLSVVRNLQDKNFVFFTPNLLASLSMLYGGAPEKLQKIMEKAFHMERLSQEDWHRSFHEWSQGLMSRAQQLKEGKPIFHFHQVQMFASHAAVPLTETAATHLSNYDCKQLIFKNPSEVGPFINSEVEKITEGIIKNLVSQDDLNPDLVLLMASAALFKGQWLYPFKESKNSIEIFTNSDGSEVKVEMMNQGVDNLKMAYESTQNYQMEILELPFHGSISLLLIKKSGWKKGSVKDHLQLFMTKENMEQLLHHFETRFSSTPSLTIGIPKLNLEEKIDLLEELKHTSWAQNIRNANFGGSLVQSEHATTPKLVSEVHFMVDEAGAKVAGASYSPTYMESCDPEFMLNRPFGFVLIDKETQTILSMGQVLKLEGVLK